MAFTLVGCSAHLCEAEAVASDFRQESLEVRAARLLLLGAIRMHHDECLRQVRKAAERKEADILLKHKVKTNQVGQKYSLPLGLRLPRSLHIASHNSAGGRERSFQVGGRLSAARHLSRCF